MKAAVNPSLPKSYQKALLPGAAAPPSAASRDNSHSFEFSRKREIQAASEA
jgi:hypothetical protein